MVLIKSKIHVHARFLHAGDFFFLRLNSMTGAGMSKLAFLFCNIS